MAHAQADHDTLEIKVRKGGHYTASTQFKKDTHGGIVHLIIAANSVLAGCWILAFNAGHEGDVPLWAIGVALVAVAIASSLAWVLSHTAHGGRWTRGRINRRPLAQPRLALPRLYGPDVR